MDLAEHGAAREAAPAPSPAGGDTNSSATTKSHQLGEFYTVN